MSPSTSTHTRFVLGMMGAVIIAGINKIFAIDFCVIDNSEDTNFVAKTHRASSLCGECNLKKENQNIVELNSEK
jgi:hypothetical protein